MQEVLVFTLFDREYNIMGERLLNDVEANAILTNLIYINQSQGTTLEWTDQEAQLLQWTVFTYAL